jgi:putative ABC transport system substrate-binding protein
MRRIGLAVILILSLTLSPLAGEAQQAPKVHRIGLLLTGNPPDPNVEAFQEALRELGYVEGQNLAVDYRWANGRTDLWPELAAALVGVKVDVIVTQASPAALAARRVTTAIPIVMAYTADPVGAGLVASLGRPGGNVTGVTTLAPALSAKRLEILKEAFPKTSRVAVLRFLGLDSPYARTADLFWKETERAGHALALPLLPVEMADPNQYQRAFTAITRGRADAVITLGDFVLTMRQRIQIVELVRQHRLPAMYQGRGSVDVGGLMSYGPSLPALHRHAATYVDKILKGAKPADLPIEQPTKFDLVINLKTAKALGLTIPQSLLLRADHVIQ